MNLLKTRDYRKSSASLSGTIRRLLARQEKILAEDFFDPRLHTKKLKGLRGDIIFSFRITRNYRGLFLLREKGIVLFMIGDRKDIYRSF